MLANRFARAAPLVLLRDFRAPTYTPISLDTLESKVGGASAPASASPASGGGGDVAPSVEGARLHHVCPTVCCIFTIGSLRCARRGVYAADPGCRAVHQERRQMFARACVCLL